MRPTKSPVAAFLSSSFSRESRKRVKRKIMHSRSLSVASTTEMKRSTTPQKVGHSMGLSISDVINMYIRLLSLIQIYYEALVWSKKILNILRSWTRKNVNEGSILGSSTSFSCIKTLL
jgi:hypothetical protein